MLPKIFLERLKALYPEKYQDILNNFATTRMSSFRINTLKPKATEVLEYFEDQDIPLLPSEIKNVYFFDKKYEYKVKGSDIFYNGSIYMQSFASCLPVEVLSPMSWDSILDVCAAPGGKTTQIAANTNNQTHIVALEKNAIRYDKLLYNIKLQGAEGIECIKADANTFLQNTQQNFDKILLDVPCSAEGKIMTNNERTYGFWSLENIKKKSELQRMLLESSWKHLKDWWELVYSTCTIAPEENEEVISLFLRDNSQAEIVDTGLEWKKSDFIVQNIKSFEGKDFSNLAWKGIRILPSKWTEWFFIVKLRKHS